MLMEVKKHIKLLSKYFLFNLKCSLEYRVSFITQIIGMVINNSSFLFFWWVIYSKVSSIKGYTFSDVMVLWGLAASTFGFAYILFGNVNNISEVITSGSLDSFLLQPKDVIINACGSKTEVSAWGDLLYGIILLILSGNISFYKAAMFLLFTITGGIIFFSSILLVNSLALYIGNIEGTKRIYSSFFLSLSTYPDSIFPKLMQIVFFSILPVGFLVYLPVKVMRSFNLYMLVAVLLFTAAYLALAYFVFYRGLQRYESGNLLDSKL